MQSEQSNRAEGAENGHGHDVGQTHGAEHGAESSMAQAVNQQSRDIAEVPAVELINTVAVHLMSAAAVKLGLADDPQAEELKDLDEARKLITSLAG